MGLIPEKFNKKNKILPVILSGGSGTRLWPLSRACFPKQYLNLSDENKFSLIQNTFLRLRGLKNLEKPIIICNEEHRFIVAEQMRQIKVNPKSIVLEPFGKNTAPAIALAALIAKKNNYDPFMLILSADHQIKDTNTFKEKIIEAITFAKEGKLITFGTVPNGPETGYGYIEAYDEFKENIKSSPIKRFVEKPPESLAKEFIKDKRFTWNSGIFVFKASTYLNELKIFEPEIIENCKKSLKNSSTDLNFNRIKPKYFENCKNISIDNAVMEKTKEGIVIPLDVGWSDIGSWKSVWENSKKDENGNSLNCKTIIKKTNNCYIKGENRLVVGIGIKDLIVIDTKDAILIADKYSTQLVKDVVRELDKCSYNEGKFNKQMFRPWGNYTSVVEGNTWQVKRLEIKSGASLSLQMHHHRAEHWVVVDGIAKVEIEDDESILNKNESIYVPLGAKHRLSNPGKRDLILIEVQSGNYLGEDDIIRFEDIYGRGN